MKLECLECSGPGKIHWSVRSQGAGPFLSGQDQTWVWQCRPYVSAVTILMAPLVCQECRALAYLYLPNCIPAGNFLICAYRLTCRPCSQTSRASAFLYRRPRHTLRTLCNAWRQNTNTAKKSENTTPPNTSNELIGCINACCNWHFSQYILITLLKRCIYFIFYSSFLNLVICHMYFIRWFHF